MISAASARPHPCRDKEDLPDIRESADLAQQAWSLDRQNATAFALVADSQRCLAMNLDGNGRAAQALSILDRNHELLMTGDPALPGTRSRITENWIESSIAAQDVHDLKTAANDAQQALDAMKHGKLQPADQLVLTECFSRLADLAFRERKAKDGAPVPSATGNSGCPKLCSRRARTKCHNDSGADSANRGETASSIEP